MQQLGNGFLIHAEPSQSDTKVFFSLKEEILKRGQWRDRESRLLSITLLCGLWCCATRLHTRNKELGSKAVGLHSEI